MPAQTLQQLNVRLDANVKRMAEDVLSFVGSSATEIIRALYEKIACGAADYTEVMAVLSPKEDSNAADGSLVCEGWSIAEEFYRSIGCDSSSLPIEARPWKDTYEEAMSEHFREKGVLQ